MNKSSACYQHSSLSGIMMSRPELGVLETSYSTMHRSLLRKAATKVVRPRSDQGSRCTDKDRSEGTEDRALISAITFLSMKAITTVL